MTASSGVVLYGSTTSPFVRKIRVALIEKGIDYRFELTPPWSPTSGVEKLNPLRKVPVLKLADGTLLADSRVIVQYLDVVHPTPLLLPLDPLQRIAVLQTEALADGISEAVALYVQEGWRAPNSRSAFWLDRQKKKVVEGIAALETDMQTWSTTGGPLQLAAIATGAALNFTSFWLPDLNWQASAPRLVMLCQSLEGINAWNETRPILAHGAKFPSL